MGRVGRKRCAGGTSMRGYLKREETDVGGGARECRLAVIVLSVFRAHTGWPYINGSTRQGVQHTVQLPAREPHVRANGN